MNRKLLEKFFLIIFLCFFILGLGLPILKALKTPLKATLATFSVTPSNLTAGVSTNYRIVFQPLDVTLQPVDTINGIELNFGTYGFSLSDAVLAYQAGFSGSAGSLIVDSITGSQYITFKASGALTYGTGEHTLTVDYIVNPTVSGVKQITVTLNKNTSKIDTGTATATFSAGAVSQFVFTPVSTSTYSAGSAAEITIKAADANNNTVTGHSGNASITQSGGTAANISYSGTNVTDNGDGTATITGWSSGQVVVNITNTSTGSVTFTVTDATDPSISDTKVITWSQASTVTHYHIDVLANPAPEAGSEISLRVYAKDANDNTNTSYNGAGGNVNVTQSGGTASKISYSGSAMDMSDGTAYIPTSKWSSNGYVDVGIKDKKAEGPVTFTFREAATTSITGSIQVTWRKGGLSYFTVTPSDPSPPPGANVTLTVKAYDATDAQITDYSGSGTLTANQGGSSTALSHVRFSGTGVIMNDQPSWTATYNSTAWSSSGIATFLMVNYVSDVATSVVVTSTSESGKTGRSTEITWQPAPTGTVKMNTSTRTIPPDNSTTAVLTSDDIYDTNSNRIPNGSVFTIVSNLGTITDSDVNPWLPETQVASTDGKIPIHLKSNTNGIAYLTFESLSLTPPASGATYEPSAKGDTKIIVSPLKVNSVSSPSTQVNRGDQNIPVEIVVENISSAAVSNPTVKPTFYKEIASGYDVTGEYDITSEITNPSAIAAGSTATYKYKVAATRLKTNGTILLDAILQLAGTTLKYGRWSENTNTVWCPFALTTDTWTGAGGTSYSTDLPNYIYHVKSSQANTSSNFLNGDYVPANSGIEITFYDSGYRIFPTLTYVKLNDETLVLNVGYFYDTATGILTIPNIGEQNGTIKIKLKDTSGRDLPEATITFKVNKNMAQSSFLCYPNPAAAGSSVKIGFNLSKAASTKIFIFNSSAELVWTTSFEAVAGYNEVTWDGLDVRGAVVGGGIYTLRLLAVDSEGHQIVGRTKLGIL